MPLSGGLAQRPGGDCATASCSPRPSRLARSRGKCFSLIAREVAGGKRRTLTHFGYRSTPVGTIRIDKKGRPRPEGYKMVVEPAEAAVVLRIFRESVGGKALTKIVRDLNVERVAGRMQRERGWFPAASPRNPSIRRRWHPIFW